MDAAVARSPGRGWLCAVVLLLNAGLLVAAPWSALAGWGTALLSSVLFLGGFALCRFPAQVSASAAAIPPTRPDNLDQYVRLMARVLPLWSAHTRERSQQMEQAISALVARFVEINGTLGHTLDASGLGDSETTLAAAAGSRSSALTLF